MFRDAVQRFQPIVNPTGCPTQTRSKEHQIELTTTQPFRLRRYPCSTEKQRIIWDQAHQMLIDGIIEPSNSPYSSPVVIVTRKNGKPRFCVDYRRLNAITIDTSQKLPHIQDTLKDLGNACVFSTIDLRNGYWKARMEEQ